MKTTLFLLSLFPGLAACAAEKGNPHDAQVMEAIAAADRCGKVVTQGAVLASMGHDAPYFDEALPDELERVKSSFQAGRVEAQREATEAMEVYSDESLIPYVAELRRDVRAHWQACQ
jgi:hypothetical protein